MGSVRGAPAAGAYDAAKLALVQAAQRERLSVLSELVLDHVVVGAGVSGLVAAAELREAGKTYVVLEMTGQVMGCWRSAANSTSHVAVCEPSYRFDLRPEGKLPTTYPGTEEMCRQGERFVCQRALNIEFHRTVCSIHRNDEDLWEILHVSSSDPAAEPPQLIVARGVFIAIGAQQIPRSLTFRGEQSFGGVVNYGIRDEMDIARFRGARVCIVGCGSFAVENVRTALINGAAHVTLVFRTAMQCWPRLLGYYAASGSTTVGELAKTYEAAVRWAGLEGVLAPFMSRTVTTQPAFSDVFFAAYKAGRLTLKKGQVAELRPGCVELDSGERVACEVLLKCVGWQEPQLAKVFPQFKSRRFVFLNGHASAVFVSDPHYEHGAASDEELFLMSGFPVKGGHFSVPALALLSVRLQLLFMSRRDLFPAALEQLPESSQPVCSWSQQRFHFNGLPEVNSEIDRTLDEFKSKSLTRFPTVESFVAAARELFTADCGRFLDETMPYIFNPDGSS